MRRKRTIFCCLATMSVIVLIGCSSVGPLCKSEDKIRASILKKTPLGCSYDQVHAFIKHQGWAIDQESREEGITIAAKEEVSREAEVS